MGGGESLGVRSKRSSCLNVCYNCSNTKRQTIPTIQYLCFQPQQHPLNNLGQPLQHQTIQPLLVNRIVHNQHHAKIQLQHVHNPKIDHDYERW